MVIVVTGMLGADKKGFCKFLKRNFKKFSYRSKIKYSKLDFYEIVEILLLFSKECPNDTIIEDHPQFLSKCIIPAMVDCKMISQREEELFNKIYETIIQEPSAVFICLSTGINICFEKLIEDNVNVDFKFLQKVEKYYKQWMKTIQTVKIDINEDIESNEKIQKEILKLLIKNTTLSALLKS